MLTPTQVQCPSPGVQYIARVFFVCKASGIASFVLRRVVHYFPWGIAAQHGCWRNSCYRAGLYIFLLSLGGFPLCERTHICSAIFEVYEAATLPAETLPPKQEIQGGTPAIFF